MSRLYQLAINEEGFAFDPTNGESFILNKTGLKILKGLKEDKSQDIIAQELTENFEVELDEAERDVTDFIELLRTICLL